MRSRLTLIIDIGNSAIGRAGCEELDNIVFLKETAPLLMFVVFVALRLNP